MSKIEKKEIREIKLIELKTRRIEKMCVYFYFYFKDRNNKVRSEKKKNSLFPWINEKGKEKRKTSVYKYFCTHYKLLLFIFFCQ